MNCYAQPTRKLLLKLIGRENARHTKKECDIMTKREIKKIIKEIEKQLKTASGCEYIALEEQKSNLEFCLLMK